MNSLCLKVWGALRLKIDISKILRIFEAEDCIMNLKFLIDYVGKTSKFEVRIWFIILRFFKEFWWILKKPQNYKPHPRLKLWGFMRLIYQKPQIHYAILSLKNPRNFWNAYPQPQKASNFKADTEDPRILRSQFTALVYIIMYVSGQKQHSNSLDNRKVYYMTWWSSCK